MVYLELLSGYQNPFMACHKKGACECLECRIPDQLNFYSSVLSILQGKIQGWQRKTNESKLKGNKKREVPWQGREEGKRTEDDVVVFCAD